jgi:hypothetical protein
LRTNYAPRGDTSKTLDGVVRASWLNPNKGIQDTITDSLRHVVDLVRDLARATFRGPNTTEGLAEVERRCDALLGE